MVGGGQMGRGAVGQCLMAAGLVLATAAWPGEIARAQDTSGVRQNHDSVNVHFVDADLRAVIQALGRYLTKPVLTAGIPGNRVTLETPAPVAREAVPPEPPPPSAASHGSSTDFQVQLFVVRLKHAHAADVAATVNLLFGGSGAFSGSNGLSSGTLSDELKGQRVPPVSDNPGLKPVDHPVDHGASLSGEVTIVPDEITNSLLIRASQEDFDVLRSAVDQLDIRPLQVLIEVLIVEARRDRNFTFGTDLFVPPQPVAGGTGSVTNTSNSVGDLVIRLMNLGKADIDATLRLSETRGDVSIISRPVLLASNNTEARFLVGSQRPFVQVSRLLPTDNNNQDRVIQYRDVGTKLTVRPTINQDGYVSLLIQQEINAATNEVAFDAPVISTREAETQVLVRDGQTIVLGGLRDLQKDRSSSGVPILSGIPLIGGLFGSTGKSSSRTELYLFLTPRILKTDADVDSVTVPRLPAGDKRE
jgi:general secretion pathway protein D